MSNKNDYGFTEVMTKTKQILDSIGRTDGICDGICAGADCKKCPFSKSQHGCGMLTLRFIFNSPSAFAEFVMDYEPPTDWSEVKVDTPILVCDNPCGKWLKRHFAKYEDGKIYAWSGGLTSFTADGCTNCWSFNKLYLE